MGINEWNIAEIDALANVIDPHPSHRVPKEVENGIPFVGIGDIDENGNINRESARIVSDSVFDEHKQRYDLSKPLIGIGRVASLGKVIKLRNDLGRYAVSPTMAVLDFYGIDPSFAYYYMCSTAFQKQFSGASNGSTRQSVGMQYIRKLYIRYPDYDEQKRIANSMLDIDRLIGTIQKSIVKKMDVFTGVLQDIEKKHLYSGVNEWPIVSIGSVASVIDPHPSHRAPIEGENGIPFAGIGDFDESGNINFQSARLVPAKVFEEHKTRYDLNNNLIGIGRIASLGKVIRLRNDMGQYTVSPTIAILDFKNEIDSTFAYYYMKTNTFQEQFSSSSSGSTRKSVGMNYIRTLQIACPPLRVQKEIAEILEEMNQELYLWRKELQKLKDIKKGMMDELLTGKVRLM